MQALGDRAAKSFGESTRNHHILHRPAVEKHALVSTPLSRMRRWQHKTLDRHPVAQDARQRDQLLR